MDLNPIALRMAKIVYNFGHSECNRVNEQSEMGLLCLLTPICPNTEKFCTAVDTLQNEILNGSFKSRETFH